MTEPRGARRSYPTVAAVALSAAALLACCGIAWGNAAPQERPAKGSAPQLSHGTTAHPRVLHVGPRRELRTVAAAAQEARDGDIVEIDAGDYSGDVAAWSQSNLTIRAVGGRARLRADGRSAEGKAIFVIKGTGVVVENISFSGTRVPSRNGAGIRHEGGRLVVRRCVFADNEMGILTSNSPAAELEVDSSEFRDNAVAPTYRAGDPIGHQIYAGTIGRFVLRASYVHRGAFGHLVKSRARESHIEFNRITDEAGGRASYELEFPNGGVAFVIGNVIQQSALTENEAMVSFGAEGYRWPSNHLYLVNNTLVDDLVRGGAFLRVLPGADEVLAYNNLMIGPDAAAAALPGRGAGNAFVRPDALAGAAAFDLRLRKGTPPAGEAIDPGVIRGVPLRPRREYVHPMRTRRVPASPYSPGAMQTLAR